MVTTSDQTTLDNTVQVHVRITKAEKKQLELIALQEQRSLKYLVSQAIADFVKNHPGASA